MRCHICNMLLEEPVYNSDHKDYDPCPSCLVVIHDTLASFKDKAVAEDEDLPSEDPLAATGWEGQAINDN